MRIWRIVFELWTKTVSGGQKKLRLSKKHVHIHVIPDVILMLINGCNEYYLLLHFVNIAIILESGRSCLVQVLKVVILANSSSCNFANVWQD